MNHNNNPATLVASHEKLNLVPAGKGKSSNRAIASMNAMALPFLLAVVATGTVMAGTDTTFDSIYTTVEAWAEGSLGKLFAVSAFIIGMGIGLVKQSAMAIVLGLAFALIMFYGPGIIANIVTFAI